MHGLCYRLVHDYDNTNWSPICFAVFDALSQFFRENSGYKQIAVCFDPYEEIAVRSSGYWTLSFRAKPLSARL